MHDAVVLQAGPDDYPYGTVSSFIIGDVKGEMAAGIEGSLNALDVRDLGRRSFTKKALVHANFSNI